MVVASVLVGSAVPALVYKFREAPSAAKVDLSEIAHNQKATGAAFDLDQNITTVPYDRPTTSKTSALRWPERRRRYR